MNRRRLRPIFVYSLRPRFSSNAVSETEKDLTASKFANELLEAVNSASNTVRAVYLALLSFSIFLAFTTGTLSDEKLLYDRTAILPLIEHVELPLSTFYFIAPWILVFIHTEAIIHFTLLASKLSALRSVLRRVSAKDRDRICTQVSNFPFSHWLLGTQQHKPSNFVQGALIWFPVFVLPVLVLVFAQLAFLPYQSEVVTWSQRVAVLADTALLIAFYPALRGSTQNTFSWWGDAILFWRHRFTQRFWLRLRHRYSLWRYVRAKCARRKIGAFRLLAICATAIFITWFVATIPGERWETLLVSRYTALGVTTLDSSKAYGLSYGWGRSGGHMEIPSEFSCGVGLLSVKIHVYREDVRPSPDAMRAAYPLDAYLPKGMVALCPTVLLFHSGIPWLQRFHRTLNAREMTIVSSKVSDDIELKLRSHDNNKRREAIEIILPIDLRGRNFRFADFSSARLPKADLRGIDAVGARFNGALLESVKFASFRTNLLGAKFYNAELRGADFNDTNLALASFGSAKLQGATFNSAKMSGADLSSADLTGASLSYADLPAADLSSANMTGVSLVNADMRTAHINYGKLVAANLNDADLRGASLQGADLTGARLRSTAINGADFTGATTRLNIVDLSEERWGKPEKDEFLDDMSKVGLHGLGLQRLDQTEGSAAVPEEPFRPSDCGGSHEMALVYGCTDMQLDTPARSRFAKRFLSNWADTACADHQDPIVAKTLARRIPHPTIVIHGFEKDYLRSAAPEFSRRLLSDKCLPASHLDKDTKDILREWVRRANSSAMP